MSELREAIVNEIEWASSHEGYADPASKMIADRIMEIIKQHQPKVLWKGETVTTRLEGRARVYSTARGQFVDLDVDASALGIGNLIAICVTGKGQPIKVKVEVDDE